MARKLFKKKDIKYRVNVFERLCDTTRHNTFHMGQVILYRMTSDGYSTDDMFDAIVEMRKSIERKD